jgi:hypothetical protein
MAQKEIVFVKSGNGVLVNCVNVSFEELNACYLANNCLTNDTGVCEFDYKKIALFTTLVKVARLNAVRKKTR